MKVLVFLPTYNERENIGEIIEAVNQVEIEKEILIVDDNSNDGTLDIIKKKMKQIENLKLIIRKGVRGRGLAGIVGMKFFLKSDCDVLIEMDADFSHSPKYIPEFLRYISNYHVVIGSRLILSGGEHDRKLFRSSISLFANFFIRIFFGIKIKDCTSGFRAFRKDILKKLNFTNFISINPEIVEELLYGCVLSQAKIKEIPIVFYERQGGKSKLNLSKILSVLIAIIKIRVRGKKILK